MNKPVLLPKQVIVIIGNPTDGFMVYGPFDDTKDTLGWMKGIDETCWLSELENFKQ